MNCSRCGHDYPSTSVRCTRCGHIVIKESSVVNSRLIEFPQRARMPEKKQQRSEQLPAWRLELSEKVRARKAQQAAEEASSTPLESHSPNSEPRIPISEHQSQNDEPEMISRDPRAIAAIERVQRASEKAMRARVPRIEPAKAIPMRKVQRGGAATATALDMTLASEPKLGDVEFALQPAPTPTNDEIETPNVEQFAPTLRVPTSSFQKSTEPLPVHSLDQSDVWQKRQRSGPPNSTTRVATLSGESHSPTVRRSLAEDVQPIVGGEQQWEAGNGQSSEFESVTDTKSTLFAPQSNGHSNVKIERPPVKCIDENFAIDYLETELQKEAQWLSTQPRETSKLRGPALIILIDLLVIALSCAPFLLVERWILGSTHSSLLVLSSLSVLISAFYLFITQSLCGKTFGMMKMRMHIAATSNAGAPSVWQIGLRTASFYLSLLPAFLGFIWVAIDPQHRSWMDLLSGTQVVPDSSLQLKIKN